MKEGISRRTFGKLAGLATFGALGSGSELAAQDQESRPIAPMKLGEEVVLEDAQVHLAFDSLSGALVRMERKSGTWVIERRPELGASFRLFVPLSKRRDNFIIGTKQKAISVQKIAPNKVRMRWENLLSEHGGVMPIAFTGTVTLENGKLTFDAELENNSDCFVEAVDYPYFGDFNPPSRDSVVEAHHMWVGALSTDSIYPRFDNAKGYWGVRWPTRTIESSQSQYCLLQAIQPGTAAQPGAAAEQGIYVAIEDPEIRYLMEFTFEQHPGVVDWTYDDVPKEDEISGWPVHLEFRTCHFVFAHPHSKVQFAPIVMRTYDGDWHAGLDVYKQWRETWFKKPRIAPWAQDVHSWLQLRVDGAEQDYSVPYRDLVKYGTECAENGVAAIQLVGWNKGGQDGGDPSLDTDPGLGTWQELHDAVAELQAKGVHMILFGKPIFADMSTDYYKKELYKYEAVDPYGNKYESGGYAYTTPTQLAGINQRRRAIMDVCSPAYREIATHEFEKILALGAHGWLFDEVMQHNGVLYNFAQGHGYTAPGYLFSADIPLVKQFRAAADKVNPDFLFAGEGPGDWLMPYYFLGYYRIGTATRHALRYLDSQAPLMAAVRGFNAREEVNLCLLYRYIISYEPFNFKGHVTDFPLTLDYGKKVDALRRKYRKFLWDAEFRDTLDGSASANGLFKYSVFIANDKKRAVVVMNLEEARPITVNVAVPGVTNFVVATPEDQDAQPNSGTLTVPARSAAVFMEA
ncbi:MAG TPA: DUF6259 domain-containing protein [Acidobacteriaceae bacterium]|nr:DUF6259 domain-containing protein [Acidobacteriaceae bacterium]